MRKRSKTMYHHLKDEHGYTYRELQGRSIATMRELHIEAHREDGDWNHKLPKA